jgi:two-component system NtrC family response regulator
MAAVLVVDDEKNYLWMLNEILSGEGFDVVTCEKGSDALAILSEGGIDVLLTDLRMAEMDGLAVLEKARDIAPSTTTVLMTAYGTIERVVEAMRRGAYDFIVKPFERADLVRSIQRAAERTLLLRENQRLSHSLTRQYQPEHIVAKSAAMQEVLSKVHRVKDSKRAVLISGESGVGKELVARAIHFGGSQSGGPFLAVNCSALADSLAESELFGHEKGAFTGASARHRGWFEQADRGTLFLDEIGELSLGLQAKLLRVLDTHEIRRVGSEKPVRVDFRLLSATNRDLKAEVQTGRFREDLFFRLSVVRIDVPALRDRPEDIPLLAESHLQSVIREGGVRGRRFSPEVYRLFTTYRWPGNVRELQNVVSYAALMARDEMIQPGDLPPELLSSGDWIQALERLIPSNAPLEPTLRAIEERMIDRALAQANGVQARAAELLKISRSLLQYKLKHRLQP